MTSITTTKSSQKVIWITGASSGIGAALACEWAKTGAKLVLSARREAELIKVKQNTQLADGDVLVLPMDMTAPDTFADNVKTVLERFGKIDILVHNAGITQRSLAIETKLDVYRSLLEVNFWGAIALTKAVLPSMVERKAGHFVVISSIAGKVGTPQRTMYCATKHALNGFFDSLRAELSQDNIQVTIICPGYIQTNISINALNAVGEKHNQMDANQANGISPQICAKRIITAVRKNKLEVYIGKKEVIAVYLKSIFPQLWAKIAANLR